MSRRRITILGATGSIGRSTLDLVSRSPERYEVVALTAHRRVDELAAAAILTGAKLAVVSMIFQLGFAGFSKFKRMIGAFERGDLLTAKAEGLDSLWAKQTPERAAEVLGLF